MGAAGEASGGLPMLTPDTGPREPFSVVPSLLFWKSYASLGPPLSWPLGDLKVLNQVTSPLKEFCLPKYQMYLREASA